MNFKTLGYWQKRIFVLCWLAYSFAYFCRVNISVAMPAIQEWFGWSNSSIGIIGSSLFWVYAIGQLINGYIGDRVESRIFVFIGLGISAIINIAFGFMHSLIFMTLLWGINGFFQSMLWGPIMKTLSQWFPHHKRNSVAVGISTTAVFGYLLAWGLSGLILYYTSWQWAFRIPGIIVIAFTVVWVIMARNKPDDLGLVVDEKDGITYEDNKGGYSNVSFLHILLKSKLLPVAAACMMQGLVKDSITLWGTKFFMETQNISLQSSISLVIVIPVINFFGIMSAGWLNKKYNDEKRTSAILFAACTAACLGLFMFSGLDKYVSLAFLSAISALMSGANMLLISIVPLSCAKYNKVSTVAGFLDFCSYIGSGITGILTGYLVDKTGWNGVLIFWILASAACMVLMCVTFISSRQQIS